MKVKVEGKVQTEWCPDGRDMILLAPLYVIVNGMTYEIPMGSRINGLTSPRIVWRIQPPYVGKARRGSVVHDVMCVLKMGPWPWVHEVFYHIMIHDGTSKIWAWCCWWFVRYMGPGSTWRWLMHAIQGKQDPLDCEDSQA